MNLHLNDSDGRFALFRISESTRSCIFVPACSSFLPSALASILVAKCVKSSVT